ncbi:Cupredoxin [Halomonas sp. HNIBRBA4712]|uniref:Cupredoxin n=1 Tax=Halomonas sp. HNIBRBA4712 TaxID=3373087 RepID=UPI0037457C2D
MALSPLRLFWGSFRVFLLALFYLTGVAEAASVVVSDRDGQPLANAVVEIYYAEGAAVPVQQARMIQRNAAFHPTVMAVPVGSQVTFPNEDTTRHHVYSFSPAKTFELNLYLQETPAPVTFDQTGVVVLGCNIHDAMQAFIVVSDAPFAETTGSDGRLDAPNLPPGNHRVRVWHPRLDDNQQIWWEGEITPDTPLEVRLELNALPQPPPRVSPLQQRFRQAAGS